MIQKKTPSVPAILGLAITVYAIGLIAGCGKKDADSRTSADTTPAAATSGQPQPAATEAPQSAPTLSGSSQATLADAQAAIRAKKYEEAADMMLRLQNSANQTPQQAAAASGQMRQFQQDLATAVANGDPRAIAAAQRLRQASTPR